MRTTLALLALLLATQAANSHDPNRPELNDWYPTLKSGRGPCCDGSDMHSIKDPDWSRDGAHYRVFYGNNWVEVPDDALVKQPNKDGRAMMWPGSEVNGVPSIRCFMPGSET